MTYILISRRSTKRYGTRCNHRGIDLKGDTANFVETESVILFKNFLISHISIRGSAPVLWEQKGIKGKIRLICGEELSYQAFSKHHEQIHKRYGRIHYTTLMSDLRAGEKEITQWMVNHFNKAKEEFQYPQCNLSLFDIKTECKGSCMQKINCLLSNELFDIFKVHGFFWVEFQEGGSSQIINQQKGVFRINCKSSLDRTNLFQTKLCTFLLDIVVINVLDADIQDLFRCTPPAILDDQQLDLDFIRLYQNMWAENGNYISQIYASSDALTENQINHKHSKVIGTIMEKFSNLKRLYACSFLDSIKHETMEILLGDHDMCKQTENASIKL